MKTLIELKNLAKIYEPNKANQTIALTGINLKIVKGDFLAIMGPSGSGKTTLLNILGCLDRPTTGSYQLEGEEISRKKEKELAQIRNQKIGFIFQTFNLLARYNVVANIKLPMVYSRGKRVKKEKIFELLERVHLQARARHKPNQLSGGEQQRVAIARALVNDPEIILADEPTGNLDRKSGQEIIQILKQLSQTGTTIVLVTHNQELVKEADRVIRLVDGRMV